MTTLMAPEHQIDYPDGRNEYGCPLLGQSGADGVQHFEALLAGMPPELRAAFELERAAWSDEHAQFDDTPA